MKKLLLLKSLFLLCALIVGTSAWAATTTYQHVFGAKPSTGDNITLSSVKWNISATNLGNYNSGNYAGVQLGTSSKNGSITLTSSSAWGSETGTYKDKTKITEVRLWLNLGGTSVTPTVTIGGKSATSDGTTVVKNSSAGSDWTKATKVTFTPAADGNTGVVVINVATVKAGYICAMEIDCEESTGPVTYSVNYNANGATSGTAPTDATAYSSGETVTVLDNTGNLEKTGFSFGGWNTQNDGKGTNYSAGNTFSISASTTLYAKWNFVVTDGIFDFEKAGAQEPLVDYGSGVTLSTDPYVTDKKTWTAVNVTMETSGKYRWWNADKTLRFYDTSYMEFSVPDGYVITKIDHTAGTLSEPNSGSMSGTSWVGASQSVKLQASGNFKSVTVTYTTATQSITPAFANITYVTPYKMNFAGVAGLKAYVATSANASGVTMTSVEGAVPENTPLLLIGTANDSYEVPVAASATAPETNFLRKGDGTTVFDGSTYDYILYSDGKFYQIGSGTVATNKAYLHLDAAPSGARSLDIVFDDNETTGVNEVKTQKATGEYFNLAGQRVAQPTKGLYIVNGKKYVIK